MNKLAKFVLATLLGFAVAASTGLASMAASWSPSTTGSENTYGINIVDSFTNNGEGTSRVQTLSTEKIAGMPNEYLCNDSRAGNCDFKVNTAADALTIMPRCDAAITNNCIESLSLGRTTGDLAPANFIRSLGGTKFPAVPGENLPDGSTPSLWQSSVTDAGGTNTYEVFVQVHSNWDNGRFVGNILTALVIPYSEVTGDYKPQIDKNILLANGRTAITGESITPEQCIWSDTGKCGIQEDYATGTRVQLAIRLDSHLGGWFRGRLSKPDFQVKSLNQSSNEIVVTGEPATVPRVAVGVSKAAASDSVKAFFGSNPGYVGGYENLRADYPNSPAALEAFRSAAKDTISGQNTAWSFSSFGSSANPCLSDTSKVQGLVTTNATVYDGKAPAFVNGQLSYQVGSYHYLPGGVDLNLGTYDLIMRKDTARCLYKFTSAPISASVSVTTSSGVENVSNTNFSEDANWDHFTAYGFTFSNPTISVKLTQSGSAAAPKNTITCVKGKATKMLTGANPKCPAGYKKK